VYTYLAEVVAEAGLEEGTRGGVERLAGRTQHFVNNWRYFSWFGSGCGPALNCLGILKGCPYMLLMAFFAFAFQAWRTAASTLTLQQPAAVPRKHWLQSGDRLHPSIG
jgi:hypothetical protein